MPLRLLKMFVLCSLVLCLLYAFFIWVLIMVLIFCLGIGIVTEWLIVCDSLVEHINFMGILHELENKLLVFTFYNKLLLRI